MPDSRDETRDAALRADAAALVARWTPPDAAGEQRRRRFAGLLEAEPGAVRRDHPGAHLTASALVVRADLQRVLLCLHGRLGMWVQLGGHCERTDVTVAAAALREAEEESGIADLRIHPIPIDLDIHPVNCRYGRSLHYDVRFAVLAPPDAVEQVSKESVTLGWFAPGELPRPLALATDILVAPALAAARKLSRAGVTRPGA